MFRVQGSGFRVQRLGLRAKLLAGLRHLGQLKGFRALGRTLQATWWFMGRYK